MSKLPRTCSECRATLSAGLIVRNGKIFCPACAAAVVPASNVVVAPVVAAVVVPEISDRQVKAPVQINRSLPIAVSASADPTKINDAAFPARRNHGLWFGLICAGVGFGVISMFVVCVGIAAFIEYRPSQSPAVAAAREPEKALSPPPTLAASRPDQTITTKDADALNRPNGKAPAGPKDPAPPPKEPIRPGPQGDGSTSGAATLPLDELKAASIYVKVRAGSIGASGSGFVVRAQGDTIFVVTNHHVIDPHMEPDQPADPQNPPQNPFPGLPTPPRSPFPTMPGPRFPRPPRFPFGFEPGGAPPQVVQIAALEQGQPGLPSSTADVWVVLRSGTLQEESLKAVLVADDKVADLALLKAVGVQNVPRPIDWKRKPKVVETLPVVAFGFPFGSSLDPKHKNPAITVTKGNVSALRLDGGELSEVQLDLDINPGNSGGPVVDENGALVGVAVAKIRSTRIGFAVPLRKLERLLEANLEKP